MKMSRGLVLKMGIGPILLALAFFAGRAMAQTQVGPGNTDTDPFPAYSPGSTTWEDEPSGGLQKQAHVSALNSYLSYYMVSGSAFKGKSSTTTYQYDTGGCIYSTSGNDQFVAELQIPNGSEIKYLRIYYRDTNASAFVTGYITYINPGISSLDLVNVSSTGNGGYGYTTSSEITHTVDTSVHAYILIFWPTIGDNTVEFCGMRVAYYAPAFFGMFMPLISR
jgi:hypothetical protein